MTSGDPNAVFYDEDARNTVDPEGSIYALELEWAVTCESAESGSEDSLLMTSKGNLPIPRDHWGGNPYKGPGTCTDSTSVNFSPVVVALEMPTDWEVCKIGMKGILLFSDYVLPTADADSRVSSGRVVNVPEPCVWPPLCVDA